MRFGWVAAAAACLMAVPASAATTIKGFAAKSRSSDERYSFNAVIAATDLRPRTFIQGYVFFYQQAQMPFPYQYGGTCKVAGQGQCAAFEIIPRINNTTVDVRVDTNYYRIPLQGIVPEPASWAMMIGGFGAVGRSLRRRRQRSILPQSA